MGTVKLCTTAKGHSGRDLKNYLLVPSKTTAVPLFLHPLSAGINDQMNLGTVAGERLSELPMKITIVFHRFGKEVRRGKDVVCLEEKAEITLNN